MAGDGKKKLSTAEAKKAVLDLIADGAPTAHAMRQVDRSPAVFYQWRDADPDFLKRSDAMLAAKRGTGRPEVPDFPEFCERYLGQPLYLHQLQWFDVLEGRVPRELHPSETFEQGDPRYVLINCPPEHGKTSTISVMYATWRIVKNPNVKIMFISKTQDMAKQMMYAVKNRLTHPSYLQMQLDFGPAGGWKAGADVWSAVEVYLGGDRDTKDKDPNMRAVGIGGQVYGSRVDLMIVDDAVVLSNAHEYEKQIRWIQQEVLTRGNPMAVLAVIGTRVDPIDLYAELRNPERYPTGESPWTYLAQPAVLEFSDDFRNWKTLWPRAAEPWPGSPEMIGEDGMFSRWDGKHLHKRRGLLATKTWSLAYQQESVPEDATFRQEVVMASINKRRQPGVLIPGAVGHPEKGMEDLYVIGSMDPAMVGNTGVIVYAVNRHTKKRYVLQVLNQPRATPHWIRTTIKNLTEGFHIHEWIIERNAFQAFLSQDPELKEWLGGLGVNIREHTTGKNKWDADFGVASIATVMENGFIELPATHHVEACKALVEQMITWAPETKNKTDLVMAVWFAEIRAREIILGSTPQKGLNSFIPNRWATRRAKQHQILVNLNDLAIARR